MAEVELKNLEKRYDNDTLAVQDISFRGEDGEFVVLVGPSGCGKSTTLRMVAGLEEITGGDLLIDGERVNDREPKDRDVAMVFQNYALYPHMTVFENMAFPLKMRKVDKATIAKSVEDAAQLLSISHLLKRKPKELSGGERQRVAVGRAIVRKPKVFLFDEPLSNLDAALRTQMRAELKRLQQRLGATMLYVTHDQVEAMTMGDKIVVMNKGRIEQFGSPAEVYERPRSIFVARFLGAPPMNLIDLAQASPSTRFDSFLGSSRGNSIVGFRPERVKVGRTGQHDQVSSSGTSFVEGKLILIEPIGSVSHYYIECAGATGGSVVASVAGSDRSADLAGLVLGDTVSFSVGQSDLHAFDRASGLRID